MDHATIPSAEATVAFLARNRTTTCDHEAQRTSFCPHCGQSLEAKSVVVLRSMLKRINGQIRGMTNHGRATAPERYARALKTYHDQAAALNEAINAINTLRT